MTSSKRKFLDNRHKLVKDSIEEKMKLYHNLCDISDFLLKKYKPSNFSNGVCDGLNRNSCCVGCKYLMPERGCTVRALQCKLYLCYDVREGHLYEQLSKLQSIASMNGLIHYREGAVFTENYLKTLKKGE